MGKFTNLLKGTHLKDLKAIAPRLKDQNLRDAGYKLLRYRTFTTRTLEGMPFTKRQKLYKDFRKNNPFGIDEAIKKEKMKVFGARAGVIGGTTLAVGGGIGAYKMNKKAEYVFEKLAKKKKKNQLLSELGAGGAAGAAGTTLTHSLENVQIQQTGSPGKIWRDTAKKMKTMYREGMASEPGMLRKLVGKELPKVEKVLGGLGTKGVYRGLPIKLLKVVPAMAISLPVYSYLSKKFSK